jgi:hypothetical protein
MENATAEKISAAIPARVHELEQVRSNSEASGSGVRLLVITIIRLI